MALESTDAAEVGRAADRARLSRQAISRRVPIPSAGRLRAKALRRPAVARTSIVERRWEKLTLVRFPVAVAAGLQTRENNQLGTEASGNATNYACQQPAAGLTSCRFSA